VEIIICVLEQKPMSIPVVFLSTKFCW